MINFGLTALAALILDQLTKYWIAQAFLPGESRIAIPHVLWWTYVQNTHGAFGLFGDSPVLLIGLAVVVLAVFYFSFRDLMARSALVRLAYGAIAGGAVGNIVDRVRLHYVRDFIDLHWWPVFNVADSCVTVGVVLLVVASLRREARSTRAA